MREPQAEPRSVALLGAGEWGRNLARCFGALGALSLVVDTNHAALSRLLAEQQSVRTSSSLGDALADPRIEQIVIATPPATHFELANAALDAGKHVFVEKPLCLELAQAERLVERARAADRTLMVGHLMRYHPCVVRLCELVRAGALGQLLSVTSNRLNLGKFRNDENALWSFAPHDVSVILALLGDELPTTVRSTGSAYLRKGVPGSTLTLLHFAEHTTAQIHVSWLNPFKERKLTVVGRDAMAVFDDTKPWPEKLTLYRDYLRSHEGHEPTPRLVAAEPVLVPEREPLLAECEHFLSACRERKTPRTDGAEGVRVLSVLDMAQRSLEQSGEAVHVARADTHAKHDFFAHPTAVVAQDVSIGPGTKIWHFSQIMSGARIGARCSFGQNVHVAGGVLIGDRVKVQNNVSIYAGVELEDDVFLGPSCVFTNVSNPRAELDRRGQFEKTKACRGASVGANATIVCGVTLGRYSFVAAGAVVVRDVPDYALVMGNPARQRGWMSRHGHRLEAGNDGVMVCPESNLRYRETAAGQLVCLDGEDATAAPETATR
jgi:UDP-2-acetamido-3-amino-2,3-dideoxy-glucuronate N-acetyltransferase